MFFDYIWLANPNALIPGRKPIGNYILDRDHPFLQGCTAYYPFIDGEKRNLITGNLASTNNTVFEEYIDQNFTWKAVDASGHMIGDVTNSSSYTCIIKGYRTDSVDHMSLVGTVNTTVDGFELMFNASGELWYAHEKNFSINLTGVTPGIDEPITIGFRYDENASTQVTVFVDHRIVDTDATGSGAAVTSAPIEFISRGTPSINFDGNAGVEYCYLFDYAISDQLYYDIQNDPYAPILPIG